MYVFLVHICMYMTTPFRMAYEIFMCVGVAAVGVPGFVTFSGVVFVASEGPAASFFCPLFVAKVCVFMLLNNFNNIHTYTPRHPHTQVVKTALRRFLRLVKSSAINYN